MWIRSSFFHAGRGLIYVPPIFSCLQHRVCHSDGWSVEIVSLCKCLLDGLDCVGKRLCPCEIVLILKCQKGMEKKQIPTISAGSQTKILEGEIFMACPVLR